MKKYIGIALVFLLAVLGGCSDETFENKGNHGQEGEIRPVEFVTEVSGMENDAEKAESRVDKSAFAEGDLIYVFAVFSLDGGGQEYAYDFLRLTGGEWVSAKEEEAPMAWPWNASEATFKAYYVAGLSGTVTPGNPSDEVLLDGLLTSGYDPLFAQTAESVAYGGAVHLVFKHLCAKVTFKGLADVDELWLKKDGLKDAFRLNWTGTEADGFTDLYGEFVASSARDESSRRVAGVKDSDGGMAFYIEPGDYSDISITYPYNRPYLALEIDGLSGLKANTAYTVEIDESSGEVIVVEDPEDWWEENEDDPNPVKLSQDEINRLLQAIHDGDAFVTNDGTPILDTEADGRTVLLRNLDFQNNTFNVQTVPNGAYFDGNYHFINNVAQPVFGEINGTISNLGIKTFSRTETAQGTEYLGALGRSSSNTAEITNVRLKGIAITVVPPADPELLCDVGALVGNNAGTISQVKLGGNIHITAQTADDGSAPGRVDIGGLVGQSSGNIFGVSLTDDETEADIRVTCACRIFYDDNTVVGERYVGGLVGLSTGQMEDCTIAVTVNSLNSQGVLMYTGGLVGMVRSSVSSGSPSADPNVYVKSCEVSGNVTGGLAFPVSQEAYGEGHSYTGGLIGYAYYVGSVEDSEIFGTLHGHGSRENFAPWTNAYYALGGAFGQVYRTTVTGVDSWCDITEIPQVDAQEQYRVGSFAGRTDASAADLQSGNSSYGAGAADFVGEDEINVFEGN